MTESKRPILGLPRGVATGYKRRTQRGRDEDRPSKGRAVNRVGPKFSELQRALDARRAELRANASGVSPEQVVVFETGKAGEKPFLDALISIPQLSWLVEMDSEDVAPDTDFYATEDLGRPLTTRLFLIMANLAGLDQLISLWHRWKNRRRGLGKHKAWANAFRHLRDVRLWGPRDRLEDTGLLEDWQERLKSPYPEWAPVEVELWFRQLETRSAASARVWSHVQASGGEVLDECIIPEIAYHALAIRMPIAAVGRMLQDPTVALVKSEDVHLLRPLPQQPWFGQDEAIEDEPPKGPLAASPPRMAPSVALLDGLPLQRHVLLRDRLVIDDPDGWEDDYPAGTRRHGTAMASLILHGDRSGRGDPAPRPLYVRPILRPREFGSRREEPPPDRIWIDVIHAAVLRIVGTPSTSPAAPEVRVINLSIGDSYRPFLREVSPLARLLDWLAWTRGLLFIVSAGNHGSLAVEDGTAQIDQRTILAMQAAQRHRRLLSPAESINALTVGAQHTDLGEQWRAQHGDEVELMTLPTLPSPISALGRGVQRSVKPDLLAPGGRVVFVRNGEEPRAYDPSCDRARLGPGQRAAAPGRAGMLDVEEFSFGTSNAAALTSRSAMQILEVVRDLRASYADAVSNPVSDALLVKCLLVHTSTWDREAFDVAQAALNPSGDRGFRDRVTGFLGYGCVRADRALGCELHRATLVGGGQVVLDGAVKHRIPLPPSLNTYTGLRRVVVTLAWFSPVSSSHRKYRIAALEAVLSEGKSQLAVTGCDAHWQAAKRGTLQHQVYEGRGSAVRVDDQDTLMITVNGWSDILGSEGTSIPYALAVTIEVDANSPIRVYDEIAARVGSRVRIGSARS